MMCVCVCKLTGVTMITGSASLLPVNEIFHIIIFQHSRSLEDFSTNLLIDERIFFALAKLYSTACL